MNKSMKLLIGAFIGFGLLFLLVGGGLRIGFDVYTRDFVQVKGRIVDFSYGNPVISYAYDAYEGEFQSHSRSSWQKPGDRVPLYVDPSDPSRAVDETAPLVGLIFIIVGCSMFIAPAVMLLADRHESHKLLQLTTYGQRVSAVIDEVRPNRSITVFNRHPVVLTARCRHPFTGNEITVHSRNLWKTDLQAGDQVDILFDAMNEKRYAMDVQEDK